MNLLSSHGEVIYHPAVFHHQEAETLCQKLINSIEWKQEPIKIFGKMVMQPRLTAWYGDLHSSYSYSGIKMNPLPWNDDLLFIKTRIEKITHQKFNSVLLNFYRNGNDSMGWHRDDETELGINPTIASVSFGASRVFQFRLYKDHQVKTKIQLESGSLLLMKGETQHYWQHALPKSKKILNPRINLTFRTII